MSDKTYNGWTNYATWRVQVEIFDGMEISEPMTWEDAEDYVEQMIEDTSTPGLARDYALAFLSEINWREIADNLNDYNEINIKGDDENEEDVYDNPPCLNEAQDYAINEVMRDIQPKIDAFEEFMVGSKPDRAVQELMTTLIMGRRLGDMDKKEDV